MKTKIFFIIAVFFILLAGNSSYSQNTISVPFDNGFVGDNGGNNVCDNAYYLTGAQGLGWSSIQFTQTTNSSVFVAQGNDIVGAVKITDYNGVEFLIPGFIKWRTPSGNNPHTMVFQPSPGSFTLATNSFNGSAQYTIDETKYIGLTKLGETLTINPVPGTVTGNASTSGLLDALNDILASLPKLTITGTTVFESDGIATVSIDLSAVSTSVVTVGFITISNTALNITDYDSTKLSLAFQPGETKITIDIPITIDAENESTEFFEVQLFDPEYAAITKSIDTVWILENVLLPVVLLYSKIECINEMSELSWATASEYNCAFYEIESSNNGVDWEKIGSILGNGTTTELSTYSFTADIGKDKSGEYYRIKQVDLDGQWEYFPILTSPCRTSDFAYNVYPNPAIDEFTLEVQSEQNKTINYVLFDSTGKIIFSDEHLIYSGITQVQLNISDVPTGIYRLLIISPEETVAEAIKIR